MINIITPEPFKVYSIEDHPNKSAVYDRIRDTWDDLGDYALCDVLDSLKALAKTIGGNLDYSFGIFPDRGEYIKITDFDATGLSELVADDLPLTGCCYDSIVIEALKANSLEHDTLKAIHAEGQYIYSDEGLEELADANEYLFTLDGSLYAG